MNCDRKKLLTLLIWGFLLQACGGSNSSEKTIPTPASLIPKTAAVAPIDAPAIESLDQTTKTNEAVLRHIYRDSLYGLIDDTEVDSPNASVEQRNSIGLYQEIQPDQQKLYHVSLEQNGLAYFRVTNTKPNGSKRVHHFAGVPAGYYVTMDTTDSQTPEHQAVSCVEVDVRLVNLPQSKQAGSNFQLNGRVVAETIGSLANGQVFYEQQSGYLQAAQLCAIKDNNIYFALAVFTNNENDIRYGFNYYQNLKQGDVIELDVNNTAEIIPWHTNTEIGKEIAISIYRAGWRSFQPAYYYLSDDGTQGSLPKFSKLALSNYRFYADKKTQDSSYAFVEREFDDALDELAINVSEQQLNSVNVEPTGVSWSNNVAEVSQAVSGIVFNTSLTQTYAFLTADPEIIASNRYNFPIDDLPLTLDSAFGAVTIAAGHDQSLSYVGKASLFSGILYYQNPAQLTPLNTDMQIAATGSELIQFLLLQAGF